MSKHNDNCLVQSPNREDNSVGLISINDLAVMFGLPLLWLISVVLPQRFWVTFGRKISHITLKMLPNNVEYLRRRASFYLGNSVPEGCLEKLPNKLAINEIVRMFLLFGLLSPFSRRIKTSIVGQKRIDSALKKGKGVVLWDSHFYFASSATKVALHRVGYKLVHLSHMRHGFSSTWIGMNILNPIWVASEAKYLLERVIIAYQNPAPAMKMLGERLNDNGVISITVRDSSNKPVEVPFLNGKIRVAPGAPVIAKRQGAELIPVFTIRQEDGNYVTEIGTPILLPAEMDTRSAVQAAVVEYAKQLEPFVRKYQNQWLDWFNF